MEARWKRNGNSLEARCEPDKNDDRLIAVRDGNPLKTRCEPD